MIWLGFDLSGYLLITYYLRIGEILRLLLKDGFNVSPIIRMVHNPTNNFVAALALFKNKPANNEMPLATIIEFTLFSIF
jgi:hypothetical protein